MRSSARGAGLLLVVLAASCAREEVEVTRFQDLVTAAGVSSTLDEPLIGETFCSDRYRYALSLRPGEEVEMTLELAGQPVLELEGCLSRRHGERGPAAVEIVATAADGEALERRFDPPLVTSWWRREVDLEPLAGRRVTLRLRADLPAGRDLVLADLFVRERVPIPPRATGRVPRILLISVDTLREDAIDDAAATPELARFAARAQRFSPHYAGDTWTKPSHASLLSGQLPSVHGAYEPEKALPPGLPMLAERLAAAGLATVGLVHDCRWLDPQFGFDRGFDEYASVKWHVAPMVRYTANWILAHPDEPFFFFLHTFETHSDFHQMPYEGGEAGAPTVAALFGVEDYGCRNGKCATLMLEALDQGEIEPLPREAEILRFLYGEGVRTVDRELGRLFALLEEAGLFDDMLIVLTSDHGELLLEHGALLHGKSFEEVLRVPMLVKWPGGHAAGETVTTPTSALDVVPTLLAYVGLDPGGLPGCDLRGEPAARPIFSGGLERMVRAGDLKAVLGPRRRGLFDLGGSAREDRDLSEQLPKEHAELLELIARRQAEDVALRRHLPPAPDVELDEEARTRLRALGYLDE